MLKLGCYQLVKQKQSLNQEIRLEQIVKLKKSIEGIMDIIYPSQKNLATIDILIKKFTDSINDKDLKNIIEIFLWWKDIKKNDVWE